MFRFKQNTRLRGYFASLLLALKRASTLSGTGIVSRGGRGSQQINMSVLNLAGVIVTILGLGWGVYTYFVPNVTSPMIIQNNNRISTENNLEKISTSTLNISDLLKKALKLETVLERQDFLEKYRGERVAGSGTIEEVSKGGHGNYLIDIRTSESVLVCPIEKTEENEKKIPLLKGKIVDFSGIFTYQKIFDHEGLEIAECKIQNL